MIVRDVLQDVKEANQIEHGPKRRRFQIPLDQPVQVAPLREPDSFGPEFHAEHIASGAGALQETKHVPRSEANLQHAMARREGGADAGGQAGDEIVPRAKPKMPVLCLRESREKCRVVASRRLVLRPTQPRALFLEAPGAGSAAGAKLPIRNCRIPWITRSWSASERSL